MRALLLLALAAPAACAQSPVTLMPEGSSEGMFGIIAGQAWQREGSKERASFVAPYFSMQWSNGAFVEGASAGWRLSDDPSLQYGAWIGMQDKAVRGSGSQLAPGAFAQWQVLHDVVLRGRMGVGGRDGQVRLDLSAMWLLPVNADHHLALSIASERATVSNHRLALHWDWRLGRRYTLASSLTGIRLAGSSATAPQVERRSSLAWSTALLYSF